MPSTSRTVANIAKGTSIAGITAVAANQFIKWNTIFNIRAAQRAMGLVPDANCTINTTVEELCNFRDYLMESIENSNSMRITVMVSFLFLGFLISVAWNCANNKCTPKNNEETPKEKDHEDLLKSPTVIAPNSAFYGKAQEDLNSTTTQEQIINNSNETTPLIDTSMTR